MMDNNINKIGTFLYDERVLDNLPKVDTFLGFIDLRTGSLIISAICVLHPIGYGCTFFMPMSYLLLTIWLMVAMFFAFSIVLFFGLISNKSLFIDLWIWFSMVFIVIMLMLLFLFALHFIAINQKAKILAVILGILWYILTVYFILVVNSHHKAVIYASPDFPDDTDVTGGSGKNGGDSSDKSGDSEDKSGDSGDKGGDSGDKSGDSGDKSGDSGDKSGDSGDKSGDTRKSKSRAIKSLRKASTKNYSKQ